MNKIDLFNKVKRRNIKSCLICDEKFSFSTIYLNLDYSLKCDHCQANHFFSFETKLLESVSFEIEDENSFIVVVIKKIVDVIITYYLSRDLKIKYGEINAKNECFLYVPHKLINNFSPINNRINYTNKLIRNYQLLK